LKFFRKIFSAEKNLKKFGGKDRKNFETCAEEFEFCLQIYFIVMPHAQNASSGFALRTYRFANFLINNLAQPRPDAASRRLHAEHGGGGIAKDIQMNRSFQCRYNLFWISIESLF